MIEKTQCAITKLERSYASFEKTGWNPHEQNVVDRMLHRKYKKKEENTTVTKTITTKSINSPLSSPL